VGVYLRGGDVAVAEHLLHGAQVCAALQQMCGETVTFMPSSGLCRAFLFREAETSENMDFYEFLNSLNLA